MVLATIPRPPSRFPRLLLHDDQPKTLARRAEQNINRSAIPQRTQRNTSSEHTTRRPPTRSASTSR
eukprot:6633713-Prymnesium_polylepis.1